MAAASSEGAVASGGVVKAEDLLPSAFGDGARTDGSGKADDLTYDLGSLTAVDSHQVDAAKMRSKKENYLHKLTTGNVQLLVQRVFELPMEVTAHAPVVRLAFNFRTERVRSLNAVPHGALHTGQIAHAKFQIT